LWKVGPFTKSVDSRVLGGGINRSGCETSISQCKDRRHDQKADYDRRLSQGQYGTPRESGLGLEAQRVAVEAFARQHGGTIAASFVEVETGKRSDRPELAKALEAARKGKATLLIAKLDRLARNVAFIANLMDAGVEFLACDQPFASRLTLHILAAVAEDEARRLSERTKAALQAAKARGRKLGSPVAAKTVANARAARSAYTAKGILWRGSRGRYGREA
jgi:DNA invertase Pin-like site-specific DNA recombinase